ncbi:MAG: serine/threonine-protein kinase [Pirellulales bacterium]
MKASRTACNHDQLRLLLDDQLAPAQAEAVTLHLVDCQRCQTTLDQLAADPTWWNDAREGLAKSDAEPSREWNESANGQHDEPPDPLAVCLTFLARSDNPAMLGRLGEFEILELIGSGGMGIVLKGYDHELNRFVAVKVLHPHCATSGAGRRRFVREAQAAAAVVHPHVIAIHAVDAHHRPPYLVMPYVPGESLAQRLDRSGPLELLDILRIAQQVAQGLAAAHAQGLVHRDIKPANILLERNVDRAVITDFGLARAADDASLTRSGVIAGTPPYMSPEQARGEPIDARTDLFSLGCVLYAMLTGRSPFRADTPYGILRRVCESTPRRVREIRPDCPEWLETLVMRLLEKRPAARPESARQTADWLAACLAHCQHPTQFAVPAALASPRRGRRLRVLAALGGVGASLLAWCYGGAWLSGEAERPPSAERPLGASVKPPPPSLDRQPTPTESNASAAEPSLRYDESWRRLPIERASAGASAALEQQIDEVRERVEQLERDVKSGEATPERTQP